MLTGLCRTSLRRHCRAMLPFVCLMIFGLCARWLLTVRAQNTIPLAIISAASFATDLAPESIASIFGSKLATQTATGTDTDPNTPGVQLPTQLGGTTVEVNGQRAGLFFVSAGQINFVLPGSLSGDTATVTVRAGDGSLSMGTMRLLTAAPAITFSWRRQDGARFLRPSPLIADLPVAPEAAPLPPAPLPPPLEALIDTRGPAVPPGEKVSGGTGLLKAQAICPAWGFYQYRLGAQALREPVEGQDLQPGVTGEIGSGAEIAAAILGGEFADDDRIGGHRWSLAWACAVASATSLRM